MFFFASTKYMYVIVVFISLKICSTIWCWWKKYNKHKHSMQKAIRTILRDSTNTHIQLLADCYEGYPNKNQTNSKHTQHNILTWPPKTLKEYFCWCSLYHSLSLRIPVFIYFVCCKTTTKLIMVISFYFPITTLLKKYIL